MYSYDELIKKLHIDNSSIERIHLKAIVNALINNKDAYIEKQMIYVDYSMLEFLWSIYLELSNFFDYKYNTKIDLTKFFMYILNDELLNLNAVFCPGYTENGYKDYIGKNNTGRLLVLKRLKEKLNILHIGSKFNISLADIFLENTNSDANPNWHIELLNHTQKFLNIAGEYFSNDELIVFSDIFHDDRFKVGFVEPNLLNGKNYNNFYKNNEKFYQKMNWTVEQTQERNDKLYTIYTIISRYIQNQMNGIYLPMETMYSRSKVMTYNKVCTMYLYK